LATACRVARTTTIFVCAWAKFAAARDIDTTSAHKPETWNRTFFIGSPHIPSLLKENS
jgi:hypothetical protein